MTGTRREQIRRLESGGVMDLVRLDDGLDDLDFAPGVLEPGVAHFGVATWLVILERGMDLRDVCFDQL